MYVAWTKSTYDQTQGEKKKKKKNKVKNFQKNVWYLANGKQAFW